MNVLSVFISALPGASAQGLAWGLMALGVFLSFRILNTSDLTVDGSLASGGAVCVALMVKGVEPTLAVFIATLFGMLAGLVTGILHTKCKIPAILSGILTQLALYSINLRILGNRANLPISVDKYNLLVSQRYVKNLDFSNPIPIIIFIVAVIIIFLYWFFGTEFGSAIRATGNNKIMASAQGINTDLCIVFGLSISNGLVAMSGALIAQYQGAADVNMGRGAIVIGLAAVIIGEVLFGKISQNFAFKMSCVALGSIVYYAVLQLILALGLNTNDLKLFSAIIVAIFLAIPNLKGGKKRC